MQDDSKMIIIEESDDSLEEKKENWFKRVFSPMKEGGIRGNIFLMMVTTTGCAFFYLPLLAKKSGLFLTIGLLFFIVSISYVSSTFLYYGYKATKGKTYDAVMKDILGVKIGFLANFMIYMHTFAAVVSVWLFSYQFLFFSLVNLFF